MFKKILKISIIIFISLVAIVGFLPKENQAADRSPDVIGLRIIPNPDHLSALRWYQNQKFVGSPQSLLVDGYEAVRDGRTVYINVANIDSSDNLYTNINVISYNQEAESATLDIFGQIIKHWKFNTNITDELVKPKIIKDTARLAYLADIEKALGDYKKKNGYYPKLSAGSYLTNKTISTWPSWQGTLGKELGITLPIDPVNKLGSCTATPSVDYNESTCWNNKDREFSTILPKLPQQSQVFYYSASSTGASYKLCAVMTSGYISKSDAVACDGSNFINHKPTIDFSDCVTTVGTAKRIRINSNYTCRVKTADVDNNIVTFESLSSQPAEFSLDLATGVISGRPTSKGRYALEVAVKDNLGATNEASYSLDVYTYCGDGKKQSPNGEMPSANEQCDGIDGTPANATCKADCTAWGCNSNYHQDGQNIACVSNTSLGCTLITLDVNAVDTVKLWTGSAWSGCKIRSCKDENLNTGYHLNVNTNKCDPNWQNCTVTTGTSNASSLEQYWIKSSSTWGGCIIKSCNSGFHLDNNNCVSSIRNCAITNASSAQDIWTNNAWTGCKVVSCNNRFFNNGNNSCISTELLDACNMLNASSTRQFWNIGTNIWGPCEIISCRSGYFLNNNICVQNFIISGNVKNVMTLAPIVDADIQIRDFNNNTVKTARTNALGDYFVNIDIPGNNNYNVIIIKAGFEQGDSGSFLLDRNAIKNFGLGSLSSGVARIVLSWGDSPRDLDAYLDFFGFQVSHYQNNLSSPSTLKIEAGATLNTDVAQGFGPEVITISALVAGGDYRYSVKTFNSNNNKMNAKVEVFNASGFKVREYLSGDSTTLWNVFQMTDMGIIL